LVTRLVLVLVFKLSTLTSEKIESRTVSVNKVMRNTPVPVSFSAVSSVVLERSGLSKAHSSKVCPLAAAAAVVEPYNSDTVGMRTALPDRGLEHPLRRGLKRQGRFGRVIGFMTVGISLGGGGGNRHQIGGAEVVFLL
jgi:hypothetical protein